MIYVRKIKRKNDKKAMNLKLSLVLIAELLQRILKREKMRKTISVIIFFTLFIQTVFSQNMGSIEGEVNYPGEQIPNDLKVCAENVATGETICVLIKSTDKRYNIQVPPGSYYIYSETDEIDIRAYYTEFVKCGLKISCPSHQKIKVEVKSGETIKNINPQDWYE